ncbi:MAG: energy transducer TonB [Muribaculaceae bacterium]|nr:energy transducer TonB [Muribaculaceae bacterium]
MMKYISFIFLLMVSLEGMADNCSPGESVILSAGGRLEACDSTDSRIEVFDDYRENPLFKGGESALLNYLQSHITYPPSAVKDSVQGRVVVQFLVDPSGNVGEVKVVRSVREDVDAEAVRVVKTLPKFYPAHKNGKYVSAWYTLPVTFVLNDKKKDVFVNPQFPGGEEALMRFVNEHIKYPPKAAKKKVQGRVNVCFMVDKTGKVRDIWVNEKDKKVDKDLKREAMRVCKMLPDFIPGSLNGEPVDVNLNLPISFRIPCQYLKTVHVDLK